MGSQSAISLIIAEDQDDIRTTLESFIELEPGLQCLQSFSNGSSAWEWLQLQSKAVDVALLDIDMPGINGIDLAGKIREQFPHTQILICTVYDDSDKIFAALTAGANGYILKKSAPSKIIEAVQEVYAGGAPMSAEIARRVVQSFSFKKSKPESPQAPALTSREKEILDFLSQGFLYKEIGSQLFISTETVRKHVHNIYDKLHVNNRTEAILKYSRS